MSLLVRLAVGLPDCSSLIGAAATACSLVAEHAALTLLFLVFEASYQDPEMGSVVGRLSPQPFQWAVPLLDPLERLASAPALCGSPAAQPGRGAQPLRPGGLRCVAAHAVGARQGAPSPGALQVFRLRTRAMGSETLNPILPMAVSFMIGVQACGQRRSTLRQSWLRCAPRASLRPAGLTAACARSVPVAAVPLTGCVEE